MRGIVRVRNINGTGLARKNLHTSIGCKLN